ncbi:MAG: M20/M25/M40 family metallo-hydrolase, partial [Rhizomicrobium sp.]
MRAFYAACLAACVSVPVWAGDAATAAHLRDQALADNTAWDVVQSLSYEVGPRPAGSPAAARARDWAIAKLKALGFTNVHAEAFAKPSWARGTESADLVAPYPLKLAMVGLGHSVPTPAGGVEADVVVLDGLSALINAAPNAFAGKIVLINQPMTRTEDGAGYGADVAIRYAASEAAKKGAVAYLIRSVSTGTGRAPHTGVSSYRDGLKIPAAALGVPDADLLAYLAKCGPVRLKLTMQSTEQPDTMAWNISGDIKGRDKPDEALVIGGHIDSWDPGLGAIDDGAGVAITVAAAKLVASLPKHPKRTIRVVLWGSEETGGASEAYLAAHKTELDKIIVASESDVGADRIVKLRLPAGASGQSALQDVQALLSPLHIIVGRDPAT